MFRNWIVQTLRAIARAVLRDLGAPQRADLEESVAAFLVARQTELRFPYAGGLGVAILLFRVEAFLRGGKSIDRQTPEQVARQLRSWHLSRIGLRADGARALTAYALIASMDHPEMWNAFHLEGRELYERSVATLHGL